MRRTLAAVGVGVGVTLKAAASLASTSSAAGTGVSAKSAGVAGTVAAAATKGASVSTAVLVGKWLVIGAVTGAVASTTVYGVSGAFAPAASGSAARTSAPVTAEAHAEQARPSLQRESLRREQASEHESSEPSSTPQVVSAPPSLSATVEPSSSLALEVAALDDARRALAAGNAAGVLTRLQGYESRFPEARMLPEALYLRLEAFTLNGDSVNARGVAPQILQNYPTSPQASRARVVLAAEAPR